MLPPDEWAPEQAPGPTGRRPGGWQGATGECGQRCGFPDKRAKWRAAQGCILCNVWQAMSTGLAYVEVEVKDDRDPKLVQLLQRVVARGADSLNLPEARQVVAYLDSRGAVGGTDQERVLVDAIYRRRDMLEAAQPVGLPVGLQVQQRPDWLHLQPDWRVLAGLAVVAAAVLWHRKQ